MSAEGDGVIKFLLNLGFSKVEVTTFLKVGGPQLKRINADRKSPNEGKKPLAKQGCR